MADDKPTLLDWLGLNREPDFSKARWLGVIVSGFSIALIIGVFGFTLYQFIEAIAGLDTFETPESQSAAIRNTGLVLAAIIGVPFIVWRSVVAQKQVDVAEQGQITDRINKAVEGLGAEKTVSRVWRTVTYDLGGVTHTSFEGRGEPESLPDGASNIIYGKWEVANRTTPNLEVRIGAIYALERIAQDSDRDHVQIMEILCAYIRENAPVSMAATYPEHWIKDPKTGNPVEEPATPGMIRNWTHSLDAPRTDIQTALTVIGRRTPRQISLEGELVEGEWEGYRLDLRETCLQKADLSKARLNHADLSEARMQGANLVGARVQGANLRKARMQGAYLTKAQMRNSDFTEARMQGAVLKKARMQNADLIGARLQDANLTEARMQNADFSEAHMQGAVLKKARMQNADFIEARMQDADLAEARMQEANLIGARMQGAKFRETRMQGSDLTAAWMHMADLTAPRMQGTDLSAARMQGAQLKAPRFDSFTILSGANFRGAVLRLIAFDGIPIEPDQLAVAFGDDTVTPPDGVTLPNRFSRSFESRAKFYAAWRAWQKEIGFDPDDPSTWGE